MNWLDYRERLGISCNNKDLFSILQNKVVNFIKYSDESPEYSSNELFDFCMYTGLSFEEYEGDGTLDDLAVIFETECKNTKDIVSYFIAFVQTCALEVNEKLKLIKKLQQFLMESRCEFEIYQDSDGYFLFPIGASELDKRLVSDTLIWLDVFPQTKKTFSIALKQYSDKQYIRDIADNLRKALEDFLKEFLKNTKNLESNIPLVGNYLKEHGASDEIVKILVGLVNLYSTLNNKIAKHHDKVDAKFLEFLLYQTGLFIRMLIVVESETN